MLFKFKALGPAFQCWIIANPVCPHICILQTPVKKTPIAPHKISEEIFPI
jgi:hypothetical protein